ncbi:MAG: hypothetical protein IK144_04535, partial [Bacteroidaceae bacterium]|nr:hypothetical protein [Bacteroidaceae bacterium]
MKKILIMMFVAVAATNINAQLVVDSLGHVGIGRETVWPNSILSVGSYGNNDFDAAIQCTVRGKQYGSYFLNHTDSQYEVFGSFFNAKNTIGRCLGGRAEARGSNDMTITQSVIGMAGAAGEGYSAAGLLGRKLSSGTTVNFAGVYGTESA